jgi:hypothetical protein
MVYLRAIRKYRQVGRPMIYVDETYLHSFHTSAYMSGQIPVPRGSELPCLKANVSLPFMKITD